MDFTLILEGIAVLGAMGAIFGALLAFAAKIFYVEVDPKQEAVRECLAGANCGDYKQSDATGFISIYGLPTKVQAIVNSEKEGE